ncbi:cytochrome P450 76T24 [Trifolium repens]|nr:cytochrome P450 76T24 [Trifolium repens]
MDYTTLMLLISILWSIIFFFITSHGTKTSKSSSKLPPGPSPYPIIGNILELVGTNPLDAFTHLSKIYGPIITLKLGTSTTIVISSPQIAKETLHTYDLVFSSRTVPDAAKSLDHHKVSLVWMPPSSKWRTLRRACATKIFSTQQLDSTKFHRKRKVQDLINYVHKFSEKGEAFDFGEVVLATVMNSISETFISMDLFHYCGSSDVDKKSKEFKEMVYGIMEEVGRPNVVDFFPIFKFFDPQGVRKRMRKHFVKLIAFFDEVMEERIRLRDSDQSKEYNDVLDSFLDLLKEQSSELCRRDVLHLFTDLFVAGIDTTSTTVEWAMAELLHNPTKLTRLREEIQQIHGKSAQIEESDASNLPYLRAVVKETLRLHPPVPFLVPHKSKHDGELAGYMIPKDAQILVNVWSIGRDSSIWANPNSFEPERFLKIETDFKGRDFELVPFGAGRRICPGLPLASRSIHYILASLLYHFDLKLADELKPDDMDMSHMFGVTLHKAQPLRVVPIRA